MHRFLNDLILFFHQQSPIWPAGLAFVLALGALVLMYRLWKVPGVYAYMAVAFLVANLQVLKIADFSYLPHPIAMGTSIFSTLFLASYLLTEQYGPAVAKQGVLMGFAVQGVFSLLMILTVAVAPAEASANIQPCLEAVFLPSLGIFVAGLVAFLAGQLYDIYVYQRVRQLTHGRHLWLRAGLSYVLGAFLDNLIFGVLAWRVFAAVPVSWDVLFKTYILGAYALRLGFGVVNVGMLYYLKDCRIKKPLRA